MKGKERKEDGTLTIKEPAKKGRAIVEIDTDGSYVLSTMDIAETHKVKMFEIGRASCRESV